MKVKAIILLTLALGAAVLNTVMNQESTYHPEFKKPHGSFEINTAHAYPPGVGILGKFKKLYELSYEQWPMEGQQ